LTQRLRGHLEIGRDLTEVLHERLHALSQGRVVSLDVPAEIERTGERQRIALELPQVFELEELFVDREVEERVIVRVVGVERLPGKRRHLGAKVAERGAPPGARRLPE